MHYVKAKSLLSSKNGMNIYRGCQHGCIYCDSRSVCYGMEHDFDDVCVKQSAPELLENTLKKKRKRVREIISFSTLSLQVTDIPYQSVPAVIAASV